MSQMRSPSKPGPSGCKTRAPLCRAGWAQLHCHMPDSFCTTVEVPILETARLKLRGHRLGDFTNCAAMWADPGVTRYIGGKPLNEEESWTKLLRYVGHWSLLNFGYWVVEEKATGMYIGEIGFA